MATLCLQLTRDRYGFVNVLRTNVFKKLLKCKFTEVAGCRIIPIENQISVIVIVIPWQFLGAGF